MMRIRRKSLIKDENEYHWENPKKRPFSKSPVRLHTDYQHAYLAERGEVMDILNAIAAEQKINSYFCEKLDLEENHDWRGRFLERHPERYYINLDNDLLQLVVLLNKLKDYNQTEIRHHIVMRKKYKELAELYGTDLNIVAVSERNIPCIMN